ncbi:addiction module toxin, Txe/YoeB [Caballeronia temeraria]|uniref:Putative mRNA interferase YoeB n=1 Tax=Caballeronia temeraria TaxID=1777137 RepID=A0A158DP68_9BURK|nr:Txe/YoeB family addiction module toxin [Caballeronia temeraria]SAK96200.1 addiction module toxin, Txe/YoeB [Caballeronia temeraria]
MMARGVKFLMPSWLDYHFWRGTDAKIFDRLTGLINESCRSPFKGRGKPEPLKRDQAWSRRIDERNRVVYLVTDEHLVIVRCRGHYGDN